MNNQFVENDMMKLCFKCEIEKFIHTFHLTKDSQNYRNDCKQSMTIKRI